MNQVFVKIRFRGKGNKYRKLLSTADAIYKSPNELIETSYQYTPGASLESGEWFEITNFSEKEFSTDMIKMDYESVDYDSLQRDEYSQIDYLFASDAGTLYFQNISKSKLVRKKYFLEIGEKYRYVDGASILTINEYPDAIYISPKDTLYFRKLEPIANIFKGISELYREATEPEVAEFLQSDFITLSDGFNSLSVKSANRKRIALAMDTLKQMNAGDRNQIFSYIQDYCPDIASENQKFNVSSEDSLKKVLFGIEQRFYTTLIGGEKRLANSVIAL